jgi:hypothetical protein
MCGPVIPPKGLVTPSSFRLTPVTARATEERPRAVATLSLSAVDGPVAATARKTIKGLTRPLGTARQLA